MRWLIGSLCVVVFVGIAFLLFFGRGDVSVPGRDTSGLTRESVPEHVQALQQTDVRTRQQAAKALWQIGIYAKEAVPALLDSVKDSDSHVREFSAKALGRAGQGSSVAVPALVEVLKDKETSVRAAAAAALAEFWLAEKSQGQTASDGRSGTNPSPGRTPSKLGPESLAAARLAIPALREALRDGDPSVRAAAVSALGKVGELAEPAVEDLSEILRKDPDERARIEAASAFCDIGVPAKAAVPVLVECLRKDKSEAIRVNCAGALGLIHYNPELSVPVLVDAYLHDDDGDVRAVALMSLGQFGAATKKIAAPLIQAAAKDPANQQHAEVMQRVAKAVQMIEGKAAPAATPEAAKSSPKGRFPIKK